MPECHDCPHFGQYTGVDYHLTPCSKCLDRPLTPIDRKRKRQRWTGDQPAHQGRTHISLDAGDIQTLAECEASHEPEDIDTNPLPISQAVMDALAFFLRMDDDDRNLLAWRLVNPREPIAVYARSIGSTKQTVSSRLKRIASVSKTLHDVVYLRRRRQS